MSPDGEVRWTKTISNDGRALVAGIAALPGGSLVIAGTTGGPQPGGQTHGRQDMFVVRLDADGAVRWRRLIGGRGDDRAAGVATGAGGRLLVVGSTGSPRLSGAPSHGKADAVVVALEPGGRLAWATRVGGELLDRGSALTTAANGDIYIGASTVSREVAGLRRPSGITDALFARLSAGGDVLGVAMLGGFAGDRPTAMTVTASGIYVTGDTQSGHLCRLPGRLRSFFVARFG